MATPNNRPFLLIKHRVNSVREVQSLDRGYGAEIDLRTRDRGIVLNHEPYQEGDLFQDFLRSYAPDRESPLILNVKEDSLEPQIRQMCEAARLENYFFLDVTFPTMMKLVNSGFNRVALRVSEYEPIEIARAFQKKVCWAWVDCFTGRVPEVSLLQTLQEWGYRVCLVSPELQGYGEEKLREHFQVRELLRPGLDAVCTKRPDVWGLA